MQAIRHLLDLGTGGHEGGLGALDPTIGPVEISLALLHLLLKFPNPRKVSIGSLGLLVAAHPHLVHLSVELGQRSFDSYDPLGLLFGVGSFRVD